MTAPLSLRRLRELVEGTTIVHLLSVDGDLVDVFGSPDLLRLMRIAEAAREVLSDECAGVNAGCQSVDHLEAALEGVTE